MYKRKTWREKLEDAKDCPKVVTIGPKMSKRWDEGTCAIPAPLDVDAIMRRVPKGKLITINEIRGIVARRHGATMGCPITCGIFVWIAAHAAAEAIAAGAKRTNPYWRTLKTGGELNPKYPGGIAGVKKKLAAEGHRVTMRGKRYFVVDYENDLARLR